MIIKVRWILPLPRTIKTRVSWTGTHSLSFLTLITKLQRFSAFCNIPQPSCTQIMGKGVANGPSIPMHSYLPDLTEKISLYCPFTGLFLKNYKIKLCFDSKLESIMIIDVTWILPLPRTIKNTIYVAGLFLVHRLWRNKLTRLSVSMIKMIGINCPASAVCNKSRTWRGFRFVNFPQLTSFPPRRLSIRTLPFRSLMLH